MKDDVSLQTNVAEELKWNPGVNADRIGIAIRDGIVTLSGSVPSYWQKIEAENATKRVSGVRAVANDLSVDVPSEHIRDDSDIATAAARAIEWHSDLPRTIQVAVSDGWVTLSGKVNWQYQKEEAELAVKYLIGVKGIFDSIDLNTAPKVADVRERIKKELERTVDQEADRITIDTSDGSVKLRGSVRSWADDEAARRAAWSVPGVTSVEDNLRIGAA